MSPDEVMFALDTTREPVDRSLAVPTGSLGLDIALGGGWPAGRVSELYGGPGCGKSLLAYHAAARAQKTGYVAWIDTGGFSPDRAKAAGANLDELAIGRLNHVDQALWAIKDAIAAGPALVVLDTVSSLELPDLPHDELAHEVGEMQRACWRSETAVLLTNIRYPGRSFGRFAAIVRAITSIRVALRNDVGQFRGFVVKHPAMRPVEHEIRFHLKDGRIDAVNELILLGIDCGVVEKRGSWHYFNGRQLGQGVTSSADKIRGTTVSLELQEAVTNRLTCY